MILGIVSEPNDAQAGDLLEMADVSRPDSIAEFQCSHSDQEIGERNANALGLALTVDLSGPDRYLDGHGLDGNGGQQLVEESLTLVALLRRLSTADPVSEFQGSDYRDCDFVVAALVGDVFEQLAGVFTMALSGYGCR